MEKTDTILYDYEIMKEKSLIKTNPYLMNPEVRDRLIERSVLSSCGVEGVKIDVMQLRIATRIKRPENRPSPY